MKTLNDGYRILEKGEIIQDGDETDASEWKEPARWVPVKERIGRPAPDPDYESHSIFRRKVAPKP